MKHVTWADAHGWNCDQFYAQRILFDALKRYFKAARNCVNEAATG